VKQAAVGFRVHWDGLHLLRVWKKAPGYWRGSVSISWKHFTYEFRQPIITAEKMLLGQRASSSRDAGRGKYASLTARCGA